MAVDVTKGEAAGQHAAPNGRTQHDLRGTHAKKSNLSQIKPLDHQFATNTGDKAHEGALRDAINKILNGRT